MIALATFEAPHDQCSYLPDRPSNLSYLVVAEMSAAEYEQKMREGWRHFGKFLFEPRCPTCTECISIRVPVKDFQPNRSQKRAWKANADVEFEIGPTGVSEEKLDLHAKFHATRAGEKGWNFHGRDEPHEYYHSFCDNPFPIEEWRYTVNGRLIGVGYVDALPESLSLIYFYHDPEERDRSLGTYNVLKAMEEAKRRGLPHVYLGYYVKGCGSLEYKGNFQPNEGFQAGEWRKFMDRGSNEV